MHIPKTGHLPKTICLLIGYCICWGIFRSNPGRSDALEVYYSLVLRFIKIIYNNYAGLLSERNFMTSYAYYGACRDFSSHTKVFTSTHSL